MDADADAIVAAYIQRAEEARKAFDLYAKAVKNDAPEAQRLVLLSNALEIAGFDFRRERP